MKVLFVYPNVQNQRPIQLGIAALSAFIQRAGHSADLFDTTSYDCHKEYHLIESNLKKSITDFAPDLLAISCRSMEYSFVLSLLDSIKDSQIPNILGGPHPTVVPEEVISEKLVDMICLGEGEEALLELLNKMAQKEGTTKIPNIWVKKDGQIFRNDVRPLPQQLDSLPYPDWDIFDETHLYYSPSGEAKSYREGRFEMSRGCPYSCTYCINAALQLLYKGKGKYHREKSVDRIIDEINDYKARYNLQLVSFTDESFLAKEPEVIRRFSRLYKEGVGLPFAIMARPENITTEKVTLLKDAGCYQIAIGIESGNEKFRRETLNRRMTQEQIINAFKRAREAGLTTYSFNMLGLPYENRKMVFDTINLNRKIKPDYIQSTIFYPFPGTKLREVCLKEGFIPPQGDEVVSYYRESILSLSELSKNQIEGLQRTFLLYCRLPKLLYPLIKPLEHDTKFSRTVFWIRGALAMIRSILLLYRWGIFAAIYRKLTNKSRQGV